MYNSVFNNNSEMSEVKLAPIIIPTLNRINHLRRCIDSLLLSPLAKDTDLFISVDYPPSKVYENGYGEVIEFVKGLSGFKTVYAFFQNENLGPYGNYLFLLKQVVDKDYNTYIFTEDDNEFAVAFLEFMNECLVKYEKDDRIYAICSGRDSLLEEKKDLSSVVLLPIRSPYGYATWITKNDFIRDRLRQGYFDTIGSDFRLLKLLWKTDRRAFFYFSSDILREIPAMRDRLGNLAEIDMTVLIVSITTGNMWFLYPIESLCRNWGFDGSGVNAGKLNDKAGEHILYNGYHYEIWGDTVDYNRYRSIWERERKRDVISNKSIIRAWLIVMLNYCRTRVKSFFMLG